MTPFEVFGNLAALFAVALVSFRFGRWTKYQEIKRLPDVRVPDQAFKYDDLVETICPVCGNAHSSMFVTIVSLVKTGGSCAKCKTDLTGTIRASPAGQAVLARQAKAAAHATADAEIADAMKAAKVE